MVPYCPPVHTCIHTYVPPLRSSPLLALASGLKPPVAVRFCPVLYRPSSGTAAAIPEGPQPSSPQFRMVLAVATMDSVLLYETEVWFVPPPICIVLPNVVPPVIDSMHAPVAPSLPPQRISPFCHPANNDSRSQSKRQIAYWSSSPPRTPPPHPLRPSPCLACSAAYTWPRSLT